MIQALRDELVAMRAGDLRVRQELMDSGELGGAYVPRMEAVHRAYARSSMCHGWPDTELAGDDGTLALVQEKVRDGRVPAAQEAYLYDRIAMYEGRPQRYGTQSLPCPDGQYRL